MTTFLSSQKDSTAKIVINPLLPGSSSEPRPTALIQPNDRLGGRALVFRDLGDLVHGHVSIGVRHGATVTHGGMWVELVGQIAYKNKVTDSTYARTHNFCVQKRELCPPGQLVQNSQVAFSFKDIDLPYESYFGSLIRVRYFVQLVCETPTNTKFWTGGSLPKAPEVEFLVHKVSRRQLSRPVKPLKMEVGIEECLHIEFQYNKNTYHLDDIIEGKIIFFLAKLRVRHMEIDLLKVETVLGSDGVPQATESEVITRFEVMDGIPPRNTEVPVRLFLAGQPTSQTLEHVANRFSVRYFLNLVLVDEEERRYFKKQEIFLVRAPDKPLMKDDLHVEPATTLTI